MGSKPRKYKTSKIKAFILFLFLAIVFWGLTKFSKEYTANLTMGLEYKGVPDDLLLASNNPGDISFDLNATGFEFLLFQIRKKQIEVNLSDYYDGNSNSVIIANDDLRLLLEKKFDGDATISNIKDEQLVVQFEQLVIKWIPVVSRIDISFKEGFKQVGNIQIEPDSIKIAGREDDIYQLESIGTVPNELLDVDTGMSMVLPLDTTGFTKTKLNVHEVKINFEVDEFTQKSVTVPIEVVNLPEGTTVKLIPEVVVLTFDVAVNDFNSVQANDFKVVCDYEERNQDENFMIPRIDRAPSLAQNIEIDQNKIDFLIFK